MSETLPNLEPPVLLLAMPQVLDPFFLRSVVLLVQHGEEGSLGFIVNRPTEIDIQEILSSMEIDWKGASGEAFFGGPVQPQIGTVLCRNPGARLSEETASEVLPGLWLTHQVGDLASLAKSPPEKFRLLLGYAGWGAGQLVAEVLRNDWLTAPVDLDLLFEPDIDRVWTAALESVGVDPATLPSWTEGGDEEEAN